MGKPKTPTPPDPKETAAAQTSTNVSTATANAYLGNVNQKTPYGSLTYKKTGDQFINDANGGTVYFNPNTGQYSSVRPTTGIQTIPGTPATKSTQHGITSDWNGTENVGTAATPDQQVPIYDPAWQELKGYTVPTFEAITELSPEQQAVLDQNNIASLNLSKLAATQSGKLNDLLGTPFDISGAPAAGTAGNYQSLRDFMSAPQLATSFGDAGSITNSIADAGNIQDTIAGAGDITRSYGANDFSADRQRVEDAYLARMQPGLDASRARIEQQASDRGLQPGSVAYNRFVDQQSRAENDARNVAIQAGGAEQSRLVGMDRDRAVFQNAAQQQQYAQNANDASFTNAAQAQRFGQNAARSTFTNAAQQQLYEQLLGRATFGNNATQQNADNAFRTTAANNQVVQGNNAINTQTFNEQNALRAAFLNEAYAQRSQPINEITSLLSGSQIQNPTFQNVSMPQLPTVDIAGLINKEYDQKVAAAQAKSAGTGALLGGLSSLFTGILSDERAKKDIKKVGSLKGHPLYEYQYKGKFDDGKRHIGVMAQEAEKKRPDAVRKGPDGLRRVDYGALFAAEAA